MLNSGTLLQWAFPYLQGAFLYAFPLAEAVPYVGLGTPHNRRRRSRKSRLSDVHLRGNLMDLMKLAELLNSTKELPSRGSIYTFPTPYLLQATIQRWLESATFCLRRFPTFTVHTAGFPQRVRFPSSSQIRIHCQDGSDD